MNTMPNLLPAYQIIIIITCTYIYIHINILVKTIEFSENKVLNIVSVEI